MVDEEITSLLQYKALESVAVIEVTYPYDFFSLETATFSFVGAR